MQPDLFADHPAITARKGCAAKPIYLPPIPDTGWKAPTTFPRLDAAKMICIDCETYDPDLLTHGPGWGRGVGHIVGIAVGTDDGARWYFPMRHTVGEGNLPPEAVLQWCCDEFGRAHQPKVFANSQYDLGWLEQEGVHVAGDIIDVQIAEPLLDEHAHSYSLDTLAEKYLGEGKVDDALYNWCQRAYGGKEGRPQAGNIWRAPPCLVGPYAEGDVDLPLRIWAYQKALLEEQGLMELFLMEAVLPRILVKMRMKGVKIDLVGAERVKEQLENSSKTAQARAQAICGCQVDIWAGASVANALKRCLIDFPKTGKGAPSFTSEWLDHHPSEITSLIRDARRYSKAAATFIDGYILDKHINGRVHGSFHQLRSDDGGTIVGRMSSSNPNLTNIPSRDPILGPLIRSLWLPEDGEQWVAYDFSQIQFRTLVHYAIGGGADEARERYNADPATDYHNLTQQLIHDTTGLSMSRKVVKNCNFAMAFAGGKQTLATQLGVSLEEADKLLTAYHKGLPFVRATSSKIAAVAQQRGYIRGIMGRRHRFNLYEPREWKSRNQIKLSADYTAVAAGVAALGGRGVVRAYSHLGLNRLCQDGEGTHMKKAIVDCYQAGIFERIGYPLAIVHDDINISVPETPNATDAQREMVHLMENAVKWNVPMLVARSAGKNWGEQVDNWGEVK